MINRLFSSMASWIFYLDNLYDRGQIQKEKSHYMNKKSISLTDLLTNGGSPVCDAAADDELSIWLIDWLDHLSVML